jgi:hypothetical protein
MSDDDYSRGAYEGMRGGLSAPGSSMGWAGWMAGHAAAERAKQGSVGSVEWLVAPVVLAPIVAWLYPVTAAATIATAYAVEALANALGLGAHSAIRVVAILAATITVCWTVGRRDQRWGLHREYARARHVARLVIAALVVNAAMMHAGAAHAPTGVAAFFGAMFTQPLNVTAWVGAVALVHWLSRSSYLLRLYWHSKMVMWKFRAADYPVADFLPQSKAAPARPAPLDLPPQLQRLEDASRARMNAARAARRADVTPLGDARKETT